MILGYALPTILMSLPAPSVVGYEQKQTFMATWQMFPIWVAILQAILPYFISKFTKNRSMTSLQSQKNEMDSLRQLYCFLLVIAGVGQVTTFTLLAASQWFPGLFRPSFTGVFNLSDVFVPSSIFPTTKVPSIGSGTHLLLQYDQLIGSTSMALFATVLYIRKLRKYETSGVSISMVVRGTFAFLLTGPLGYAVACIWARDELIAAGRPVDSKKVV